LVRRDALEQIGGWDESYWFWYEDVDLSRRLAEIGHALYVPTAIFEHVGRASTRRWARHEQHLRLYHGTLRYAEQHLSRGHQVALAFILAVLITIRIAGLAVARRREALSAYRHLLGEARALVMARALAPGIEIAERPRADQVAR
jgi:N-acetylglucosaminyl-diphospho-decaprenol L-rhamnosyltransferase